MKNLYVLIALICFTFTFANAQETLEKMSETSCDCINNIQYGSMKFKEANQAAQDCITEAMLKESSSLIEEFGLDFFNDKNALSDFGVELGIKMVGECPIFVDLITKSRFKNL